LIVEAVDDSPHMKKSPNSSIVSDGFQVPCKAIIVSVKLHCYALFLIHKFCLFRFCLVEGS